MKPVRFTTSKWLDKKMVLAFLDERAGGVDFGAGIVRMHPALRAAIDNATIRKRVVDAYFDAYYRTHNVEMRRKVARIREQWKRVEHGYVTATEEYFAGFMFPAGEYVAYASIINCNPRFLDSKAFQFFYRKSSPDGIHTVAHELLHFIFFDFVKKNLPKLAVSLSEETLWEVSELFNVVLLRSDRYKPFIDRRFVRPYPAHRTLVPRVQEAFDNSTTAEEFITRLSRLVSRHRQKGEK